MLTRREFLKMCTTSAVSLTLTEKLHALVTTAYAQNQAAKPPVIWLELGGCTGESVSLDNAVNPTLYQLMMEMIDLKYHWLLNTIQGEKVVQLIYDTAQQQAGQFWLVVEGAVMTAQDGKFDQLYIRNGQIVTGMQALKEIAPNAKYVVAVGDCACFGGPSASHPNVGGAKGVWDVIDRMVINVPGCPSHPDWMTGTLTHLLFYGMPELDAYHRPKMFFGKTIHELCQRRQQFEDGIFAAYPGDEGCLYKVGCKGPVTHADCPLRQWNHYVNWPVKAGTPCIGCANPKFPDGMMPFYNHLPNLHTPAAAVSAAKVGVTAAALGAGAVGTHLAAGIFARRIHKHFVDGTKPSDPTPPESLEQVKQELDDLIRQQNALLAETKNLERQRRTKRKKSFLRRLTDFWRTEDKTGKEH